MIRTRNQRIKTDYPSNQHHLIKQSRPIKHQLQHTPTPMHPSNTATIAHKQSYLSRLARSISNEMSYDKMTDNEIRIEQDVLKQKAREINAMITKLLTKQHQIKSSVERIANKSTISQQMGINSSSLTEQYVTNVNIINKLNEQFAQSNQKLQVLSDTDKEMNFDKKKVQLMVQIKELREQLGRMKKNRNLREKQIIKCSSQDSEGLQPLRSEYVRISRKSEKISLKLKASEKDLIQSEQNLFKQRQIFDQIHQDFSNIIEEQQYLKEYFNQDHLLLLYSSKNRKIQLSTRKFQRNEQNNKRKYYNILLQFQASKERQNKFSFDLAIANHHQQRQLQYIDQLLQQVNQVKQKSKSALMRPQINQMPQEGDSSFFITHVYNKKKERNSSSFQQSTIQHNEPQKNISEWSSQKKFNQINVELKNVHIRKWTRPLEIIQKDQLDQQKLNLRQSNYENQSNQSIRQHLKDKIRLLRMKTDINTHESPMANIKFNESMQFTEKD